MVLAEEGARFSAVDVHLVRRAATHVALDAATRSRTEAADAERRRTLVADLLRSGAPAEAIRLRAAASGLRDDLSYVVALLTAADAQVPAAVLRQTAAHLQDDPQLGLVGANAAGTGVAIILPHPGGEADALQAQLAATLSGIDAPVQLALSTPRGLAQLPAALREAERVAACQRAFGPSPGSVLTAEELGIAQLYLASAHPDDAVQFALDTLGGVADDPSAGALLTTLLDYGAAGGSVRETARRAEIHENTVRYRLGRIAQLTGLDVIGRDTDRATARTAAVILRLAGRLPAEAE